MRGDGIADRCTDCGADGCTDGRSDGIANAGTIAGNLCNASPAADGVPPLLSLDASLELASADGSECLPLADFIRGNRRTSRRSDQLVTGIRVPKPQGAAVSGFRKLGTRRYLVISIVMVAGVLELDARGHVVRAGLAVGACSETAVRLTALEDRLSGMACAEGLAAALQASDLAGLRPIDDARGTVDYRLDAAATLLRRLLGDLEAAA